MPPRLHKVGVARSGASPAWPLPARQAPGVPNCTLATTPCRFGNCNGETGQCDCPFGLTGAAHSSRVLLAPDRLAQLPDTPSWHLPPPTAPAPGPSCQERLFPACHVSKDPGTLPHYGTWYPKNCECIKCVLFGPSSLGHTAPQLHLNTPSPPRPPAQLQANTTLSTQVSLRLRSPHVFRARSRGAAPLLPTFTPPCLPTLLHTPGPAHPLRQLHAWPGSCPEHLHYEGTGVSGASPCFYDLVLAHRVQGRGREGWGGGTGMGEWGGGGWADRRRGKQGEYGGDGRARAICMCLQQQPAPSCVLSSHVPLRAVPG